MTREYTVTLPITGKVVVSVEAENEEEAIEKALLSDFSKNDIEEWEAHKYINQGNIFYGILNEAEAEEE